jgi:serine/threonine protein phosphatase PrpC
MPSEHTRPMGDLRWRAASARGPREVNADATATHPGPGGARWVFAVADGIGDNAAAAAAADTAARTAVAAADRDAHGAVLAAQGALQAEPTAGDCVLVVAVTHVEAAGEACEIAWVGDCRAYLCTEQELRQLTVDHTVAEYFRARHSPVTPRMEHLVTTSVRTVRAAAVGRARVAPADGRLLLCTDGVHKTLPAARMRAILRQTADPGDAAAALVDTAHQMGGQDNATALVADISGARGSSRDNDTALAS